RPGCRVGAWTRLCSAHDLNLFSRHKDENKKRAENCGTWIRPDSAGPTSDRDRLVDTRHRAGENDPRCHPTKQISLSCFNRAAREIVPPSIGWYPSCTTNCDGWRVPSCATRHRDTPCNQPHWSMKPIFVWRTEASQTGRTGHISLAWPRQSC